MTALIALTAAQALIVGATCLALLYDVHQARKETRRRGQAREEMENLTETELRKIRKLLEAAQNAQVHT